MRSTQRRVLMVAAVLGLHVACYWVATRVAVARGPLALWDPTIAIDRLIPQLPGWWPLYWIAYPFILLGCWGALRETGDGTFRRAVAAIAGMTVIGAAIQAVGPSSVSRGRDEEPVHRDLRPRFQATGVSRSRRR